MHTHSANDIFFHFPSSSPYPSLAQRLSVVIIIGFAARNTGEQCERWQSDHDFTFLSRVPYNCVRGPFIPVSSRFNVFSTLEKSLYSRWEERKNSLRRFASPFFSGLWKISFLEWKYLFDSMMDRAYTRFFFLIVTRSIGCWLDVDWSLRMLNEKAFFFFADKLFRYFYKK